MSGLITLALVVVGIWLFIKALPILLRLLLYCIIAIPLWIILLIVVPGFLDESALFLILLVFAFIKAKGTGSSGGYSSSSGSYILNKKTGVIHSSWDSSADTISDKHRRPLSSSEAQELVQRGTKYRFKKDP